MTRAAAPTVAAYSDRNALSQIADLYVRGQEWRRDAACLEIGWEFFFPNAGGTTREAKTVCGSCTVRQECLDYALDRGERYGVYGGVSERERRRMLKQRRAQNPDIEATS
jgi:WhiB family redox-sensing transcriptional regulator